MILRILILSYNADSSITMNQYMHYRYFTGITIIIELNSIWMAHLKQNTLEIYAAKYQLT